MGVTRWCYRHLFSSRNAASTKKAVHDGCVRPFDPLATRLLTPSLCFAPFACLVSVAVPALTQWDLMLQGTALPSLPSPALISTRLI